MKRVSIPVRRLSFVSLLKIHYLGALGLIAPFCILFFAISVLAPDRIDVTSGMKLGEFYPILLSLLLVWPVAVSALLAFTTWLALDIKGLFCSTTIEVVTPMSLKALPDAPRQSPIRSPGEPEPSKTWQQRAKLPLILIVGTALITAGACYLAMKPRALPEVVRLAFDSPDGKFVAVVVTREWELGEYQDIEQTVHLIRRHMAEPEIQIGAKLGMHRIYTVAAIHSCENEDIEVIWTDERSLLITETY